MSIVIGDVYALVAHAVGDCSSAETHVDQQRYVTVPDVVNPDLFNAGYLTASLHLVLEVVLADGENAFVGCDAVKLFQIIAHFAAKKLRH